MAKENGNPCEEQNQQQHLQIQQNPEDHQERQPLISGPTSSLNGAGGTSTPVTKKTLKKHQAAAFGLLNTGAMTANISQLKTLMNAGEERVPHYTMLLTLVITSICTQVLFAILGSFILIAQTKLKRLETSTKIIENKEKKIHKFQVRLTILNHLCLMVIYVLTLINMFITGFGIIVEDTS